MMRRFAAHTRAAALLPVGALAVHQLRYSLASGRHAENAQAAGTHAYLEWAIPMTLSVLALGVAGFLARSAGSPRQVPPSRFPAAWAGCAGALMAIHLSQEWIESGAAAVAGPGFALAVLLSVVLGALVALALRGGEESPALLPTLPGTAWPAAPAPEVHASSPIPAPRRFLAGPPPARGPPAVLAP